MTFRGMILGVAYDDRDEFEKAARGAGFRMGLNGRTGDWKVGLPIRFKSDDGTVIDGQVWSKGYTRGTVVAAFSDGRYARINTDSQHGTFIDGRGRETGSRGRVIVPRDRI
jgi:hypothetical protein